MTIDKINRGQKNGVCLNIEVTKNRITWPATQVLNLAQLSSRSRAMLSTRSSERMFARTFVVKNSLQCDPKALMRDNEP